MNNVGTLDRVLRALVGIAMLAIGWGGVVSGTPQLVLKFLGFVPLLVAAAGSCPIYAPFGIDTRGVKK